MSKIKRFSGKALTVLLSLVMIFGLLSPAALPAAKAAESYFEMVTGDTIEPGMYMITATNASNTWAWTNNMNSSGNNMLTRDFAAPDYDCSKLDPAEYLNSIWEIGLDSEKYTIKTTSLASNLYAYAAGGTASNNYLRLAASVTSDTHRWSITKATDANTYQIKCADDTTVRNLLGCNSGNNPPLFACYASGQLHNMTLWKLIGDLPGDPDDPPGPQPLTIAQARAIAVGGAVLVEGVVTGYDANGNTFIQDATGGIVVRAAGAALVGKAIRVSGTIGLYGNLIQINNPVITDLGQGVVPDPVELTIAEMLASNHAYESQLIKISDVQFTEFDGSSGSVRNHTILQNGITMTLRAPLKPDTINNEDRYDIVGVGGRFNADIQISSDWDSESSANTYIKVTPHELADNSIAKANNTPAGQTVTIKGQATYLYANNSMMVQDGTDENDGICVFLSGANFSSYIGQIVEVTGVRTDYGGLKEVVPASISGIVVDEGEPAFISAPKEITIADLAARKYIGSWVVVRDVQLTNRDAATTAQNHTITQNGASVTLRAALPATYTVGDWLTITGCGYMFSNAPQLFCVPAGIAPGEAPPPPDTSGTDGYGIPAQWNLGAASGDAIYATGGDYAAAAKLQFIKDSTAQTLGFSSGGANLSGLNGAANNAWWYITTSSVGFKNIEVCWNMRSSGTGPRDFKLQYSADGIEWFDANNPAFVVPNAVALDNTHYTKTLPAGANNLETLYLRWLLTSNISARAGTGSYAPDELIATTGTHQINFITINGDYILGENQLRRPVANPPGGEIALNQVITLTPGSEDDADADGYAVMISTDDGASWIEAPGGSYTIATLPLTIQVKATAPGMVDSRVNTYSYTQAKLPQVTASRNSGAVNPGTTIRLDCAVGDSAIKYQINGAGIQDYEGPLTLDEALFIGEPETVTIMAWAVKDGYIRSDDAIFNYTIAATGGEQIYFGQIHSHTKLSDGSGEVEEAYRYARDVAGLDFFAVTDHSNSLGEPASQNGDDPASINLNTYNSDNANWLRGQNAAAAAYREGEFISFYGYEMTWSGGPGHMNTFNTGGFVSRNNTALNVKINNDEGLRAYYELLSRTPDSISMFNHPGTTFGNFRNFAYYDPVVDQRITLLEVGNGEGAIGSGGYFPSYEQYTMALDKGWHVAPTNSQDNHLGKWGDSNTARVAIWTNDFTLAGVYQALRDMRVYSTEVADLEIEYKVNGQPLGTIIDVVPTAANFTASIINPTSGNYVKSVSIITNGGLELQRVTPNTQDYEYNVTVLNPNAGYYYLKVIVSTPEGDRIAVTAPVWLGLGTAAGFAEVTVDKVMPVTGEALELTSTLFNNEPQEATLVSITYEARGVVLGEKTGLDIRIAPNSEIDDVFTYTPASAGEITVIVTAVLRYADGKLITCTSGVTYDVWDANGLVYIGIDGSHYNEYVDGQYKANMTNFTDVATSYGVRVNILNTEADLIAAANNPQYRALLLTVPSRRLYPYIPGTPGRDNTYLSYTPEVRDAVQAFAERGGTTIFTGWSNLYEGGYTDTYGTLAGMPYEDLMFAQQNKMLAAIGSTLRIAQDGAADAVNPYWPGAANAPNRLYPDGSHNAYNFDNPLLKTVDPKQRFSQYGGTTVYAVDPENSGWWNAPAAATLPDSVSKAVSLPEGCRSEDYDIVHPNSAAYPRVASTMYDDQYMIMATETVVHENGVTSQVIVAGGAFMSNFEIRNSSVDNISDLYSNQNIVINLIQSIMEVTPIIDVKEMAEGTIVTIEGIATTNVYSGDSAINTGFFDCIYVQDATGGINLFPVSAGVLEGQRIRVTGTVSSYQGEIQIAVRKLDVVDTAINKVQPENLATVYPMQSRYTGKLVKISGTVSDVREEGGVISQFIVTDYTGVGSLVYINAYITSGVDLSFVREGEKVFVTGIASVGETMSGTPLPRIRVRDRNEIVPVKISSITPMSAPAEHAVGDALNLDGTVILAYFDDGTYAEVTGYTTDPAAGTILTEAGLMVVRVYYSEGGVNVETHFYVTVNDIPVTLVSATPSARVDKLSGNQNRLYITIIERFSDGSTNTIEWNGLISNNAAGTYQVGRYRVYVDTKGNDQIRACYIVS